MKVYGVHTVHAGELRPTVVVWADLEAACEHAAVLSRDQEVLGAGVTRFTVDELGSRSGVALYVEGKRQQVPYVSDCRRIFSGGRKH